jgi:Na+-transporting NADH:ubiquinone oxidoreductase subunit NqrB
MVGKALDRIRGGLAELRLLAVEPESAMPSLVSGMALLPTVIAGVLLFRLPALEILGVAVAAAALGHLAAHRLKQPLEESLLLPAVVGVALVGARASLGWAAAVAVLAVALDLGRARFTPSTRLQVGLLAYALVLLVSRGGLAVYISPGGSAPVPEPVRLWLQYFGPGQSPIDPVKLYVGNVAGPVFATSMLAVAVGAAWLWYARRLSLLVVLTFLLGALLPVRLMGWAAGYQLDSGPLWFAAALVLADRRTLVTSGVGRPLLGFTAGLVAMSLRARGLAIESALVAVAALQTLPPALNGAAWLLSNRHDVAIRLRQIRSATLQAARLA